MNYMHTRFSLLALLSNGWWSLASYSCIGSRHHVCGSVLLIFHYIFVIYRNYWSTSAGYNRFQAFRIAQ